MSPSLRFWGAHVLRVPFIAVPCRCLLGWTRIAQRCTKARSVAGAQGMLLPPQDMSVLGCCYSGQDTAPLTQPARLSCWMGLYFMQRCALSLSFLVVIVRQVRSMHGSLFLWGFSPPFLSSPSVSLCVLRLEKLTHQAYLVHVNMPASGWVMHSARAHAQVSDALCGMLPSLFGD